MLKININRLVMSKSLAGVFLDRDIYELVQAHERLSPLNLSNDDKQANVDALRYGGRILTVHFIGGFKIWCISEPVPITPNSYTTIMFPSDY